VEEYQLEVSTPEIDTALCDGCGMCVAACPSGALALDAGKATIALPEACRWDGACELACPRGAIAVPYAIVLGNRDVTY
jgi:heterodisulfide reductase subunit A